LSIFRQFYFYFIYLFKAQNLHGIHSPFVFELYSYLISKNKIDFSKIEILRKKILADYRKIEVTDLGAGAKSNKANRRTVSNIIRFSSKNRKYYELISKIIDFYAFKNIIELGTSLGISSAYLASSASKPKITTFEGCSNTLNIAKENFETLNLQNIQSIQGNINETLPVFLNKISDFDLVYIDANHRYEPTINYFEQLKSKATENSCIIFDDIYWSAEMTQAWNTIKNDKSVSISLDFFEIGIVFFRKGIEKQDFILKY
jgi:predicted O-methyltransferase YrrM